MEPIILDCNAVVEDIYTDEKTGKKCIIALNQFGHRLGYVEVDKCVPFLLFDYDNMYRYECKEYDSVVHFSNIMYNKRITSGNRCTLLVHGGVTFCGNKEYLENQYMRAVGFDCGHFNDAPDIESVEKYLGKDNALTGILKQFADRDNKHIWTIEDVRVELSDLASQIYEVEKAYLLDLKINKAKRWKNRRR